MAETETISSAGGHRRQRQIQRWERREDVKGHRMTQTACMPHLTVSLLLCKRLR